MSEVLVLERPQELPPESPVFNLLRDAHLTSLPPPIRLKTMNLSTVGLLIAAFFISFTPALASELKQEVQLAQFDADDSFDPFADYSEFEAAEDEEADINFFRNGRFVTMGFIGGFRYWTDGLGKLLESNSPHFGFFLSYFFDLRFALQFSFITGDHKFSVTSVNQDTATGNIGIQNFGVDFKYYINTQNVTRGLAAFNPYLISGISQMYRTTTIDRVTGFGKEATTGFDFGGGMELPMMRNKMFFGAQLMYQLVTFKNENTEIRFADQQSTGVYPTGDTYTLFGILGVNF